MLFARGNFSDGPNGSVTQAAVFPDMTKLSRRSVPVAPSVPVDVPLSRTESDARLLHTAGKVKVFAAVHPAVDAVVTESPLAMNVPDGPVTEYSTSSTFGPVAEWYASKDTLMALYPTVGTEKMTPCGVVVYVVVL